MARGFVAVDPAGHVSGQSFVQLAEESMNPHTDSDLLAYFGPSSGRRLPPNPRSEASNLILLY